MPLSSAVRVEVFSIWGVDGLFMVLCSSLPVIIEVTNDYLIVCRHQD